MARKKRSEITAEELGVEALEALQRGTSWEYEPESIEGADQWVWRDPDDNRWKTFWYVSGWEVQPADPDHEGPREWSPRPSGPGTLWHLIWQVDPGGDWTVIDEMNVDRAGYLKWAKGFSYQASRTGWCSYYNYVMRLGSDPLGIFYSSSPRRVGKLWEFVIQDPGMIFVHARPAGSRNWIPPDRLPQWVLEYFLVERKDDVWQMLPGEYKDVKEFVEREHPNIKWEKTSSGRSQGITRILEPVPPDPKEVRAAAEKAGSECK